VSPLVRHLQMIRLTRKNDTRQHQHHHSNLMRHLCVQTHRHQQSQEIQLNKIEQMS
jgi:hypothetical protein